ncbi:unnamed protein product [Chrysoparadoxa australica]
MVEMTPAHLSCPQRLKAEQEPWLAAAPVTPMELWLDARKDPMAVLSSPFTSSCDAVLLEGKNLGVKGVSKWYDVEGDKIKNDRGQVIGASIIIDSPKAQSKAMSLVGSVEWLQVSCKDWTMIPAENLISVSRGTPTRIAVEVQDASQVPGAAFALELGVDALLLPPDDALWSAAMEARDARATSAAAAPLSAASAEGSAGDREVELVEAQVSEVRSVAVGDRICLDLIQNLAEGEGLLIGSSAKLLALVHGETFETGFVPSRPFRVNAGPVHSYVLMADGTTKYLAEVRAGDAVLVFNAEGQARPVAVGRCKIESRPMIMVGFEVTGDKGTMQGQIFLQQAETVRLLSPDKDSDRGWTPASVTELDGGEKILVRVAEKGTHIGVVVDSRVREL